MKNLAELISNIINRMVCLASGLPLNLARFWLSPSLRPVCAPFPLIPLSTTPFPLYLHLPRLALEVSPPLPLLKPLSVPPLLPWVLPSPLCLLRLFCLLVVVVSCCCSVVVLLLLCCPTNKNLVLQWFLTLVSSQGFGQIKAKNAPPPKQTKKTSFISSFLFIPFVSFLGWLVQGRRSRGRKKRKETKTGREQEEEEEEEDEDEAE